MKSLNLLLYYAGGTHDTSLLKKVDFSRYSMFFMVSKLVRKSMIDRTYSKFGYELLTPPLNLLKTFSVYFSTRRLFSSILIMATIIE